MGPPQPGARKRRLHRKSRLGCLECKKRHMKCDEGQPSCTNCNMAERRCRYAALVAPRADTASRSPSATPAPLPGVPPPAPAASGHWMRNVDPSPAPYSGSEHAYTLEHMRLLRHVEKGMDEWLEVTEAMRPIASIYLSKAFASPYCMDQLLALSALHLSTTATATDPQGLRDTATNLQTRALAGFRRAMDRGADADSTATFVFSSLIAVHVLTERLSHNRHDFGAFLDGIADHFRHHRGARILGTVYWAEFGGSELMARLAGVGGTPSPASVGEGGAGGQYVFGEAGGPSVLAAMIEASALNDASAQACLEAVHSLGQVHARLQGPDSWGVHVLLGWPNMIPLEFIDLLERRVPEALVILAHFAGYMHRCRDFWVFGDAGEHLLRGIANHLGRHWMGWMSEPLEVVAPGSVASGLSGDRLDA